MPNIKQFLNNKTFKFHLVKEEDYFDFIIEHDIELEKQSLSEKYRDHVFITDDDAVIGCAVLMKDHEFPQDKIEDCITMSSIFIHSDYRNRGLSKELINLSLNHIKDSNKILLRTKPSEDGLNYSYDKITNTCNELNIPFIEHNLSFIYNKLNNSGLFKNKDIDSKFKTFNSFCDKLIDNYKLNNKNDLDSTIHSRYLDSIIKNNRKNKP